MQPQNNSKQNALIKVIAGVVVLGLAGFAFSKMNDVKSNDPLVNDSATSTDSTNVIPNTDNEPATVRKYKNGTYAATGKYTSPAGLEEVNITLVIDNDIVTGATFVGTATNPGSVKNQQLFKDGFDQYVVGKNIDSLKLEVVNGSSLTPKGFLDALAKIKVEAAA